MKRLKDLFKLQKQYNIYQKLNFLNENDNDFQTKDNNIKSLKANNSIQEEKEFNVGLIVIVLIIILITSTSYYLLVVLPQQQELQEHKNIKTDQLDSILNNDIQQDSNKQALQAQIDSAKTVEEVDKIDVYAQAMPIIKNQLQKDINQQKDKYDRVQVVTDNITNIYSTDEAKKYLNSLDVEQLSKTTIQKVDTQIIPLSLNRKQAASGLITEGDTVDIYNKQFENIEEENIKQEENNINQSDNDINQEEVNSTVDNNTTLDNNNITSNGMTSNKIVGGATVVSILRSKDSGVIDSNTELNQYPHTRNYSQTSKTDIQQILQSKASGTLDESQLKVIYEKYGYKLSNYERISNIGDLDTEYIIMLEVPSDKVDELINSMENIILTIPSYDAPSWVKLN
ncbi:MAG: DUF515 domain-containing protein [Methanosphaera stadtmanae]|jgi:hypothetical protein|nr:DUF515 domain-containing protein [Methanosphaera stadtmanae]